MTHQFLIGTYRQTNLRNESAEYLAKREALRLAEIDLMEADERVAALRRGLPRGPAVADYVFVEGPADLAAGDAPARNVALGDLFSATTRPLIVYHLMYGKKQSEPCPMCTLWIDGINGVAQHTTRNADLAIVAAADLHDLRKHARARQWDRLRLLSAAGNTFKFDLGSEDADGAQDSTVSVFVKDDDGTVRHFYTAHPRMGPDIKERGIDLLCPLWNFLDLTPQGRGDWYPSLDYGVEPKR